MTSRLGNREYLRLLCRAWKIRGDACEEEDSDADCGARIPRGREDPSRLRHGCKRQDVSGQEDIGTAREGSRSRAASQRQGDGAGGAPSIAGGEAGCGFESEGDPASLQ